MYFYILGRESQSRYCNSEVFVRSVCDLAPERFVWVAALLAAPLLIGLLIARPRGVRIYVTVVTLAALGSSPSCSRPATRTARCSSSTLANMAMPVPTLRASLRRSRRTTAVPHDCPSLPGRTPACCVDA